MAVVTMPAEARKALQNRFYVSKSHAKKENILFTWATFKDWWYDFEELMPPDFDYKAYQIHYDLDRFQEYSTRTLRLVNGSKMRMRVTAKAVELMDAPLEEREKRVVLASELSIRLLSYTPGTSFQEILRDSLAAAGIKP